MLLPRLSLLSLCAIALSACDAPDAPVDTPSGKDVVIEDGEVEALAENMDPRTLYVVANQYATGDGVDEDQNIAERLWRVACDKGHAYACSIFGARQIDHENFDDAARTLTMAAEQGVTDAIANLIQLHGNEAWSGADPTVRLQWQQAQQLLEEQMQPAQSPVNP
ncbi:MAG: hypothetical protein AAF610_11510 [Pseudomonadota bacterium]